MITLKLTDKRLEARGHAGYAESGKDIVCSAVSILIYTFVNLNDADVLTDLPDCMIVDTSNLDISFLKKGFELVQEEYPDNVRLI
ncbi:MAG: ribosomal-processing cysteine protease Prp [Eubacterium sp.]|nr:ribosomal-processing cysteine protease Prp [Eubacterium sp.]